MICAMGLYFKCNFVQFLSIVVTSLWYNRASNDRQLETVEMETGNGKWKIEMVKLLRILI